MAHTQHLREGPQTLSATLADREVHSVASATPETEEAEVLSPRLDSVDPGPWQPPAPRAGDPATIYDLSAYLDDLHAPPYLTDIINDLKAPPGSSSGTNADIGSDGARY